MAEKRKIGSLPAVTPVGLGCMGFFHAYGAPTERKEAVLMIRKAFEMGYDFFDTAECYTGINADGSTSYNEELVGEALKDVRDKRDTSRRGNETLINGLFPGSERKDSIDENQ